MLKSEEAAIVAAEFGIGSPGKAGKLTMTYYFLQCLEQL